MYSYSWLEDPPAAAGTKLFLKDQQLVSLMIRLTIYSPDLCSSQSKGTTVPRVRHVVMQGKEFGKRWFVLVKMFKMFKMAEKKRDCSDPGIVSQTFS